MWATFKLQNYIESVDEILKYDHLNESFSAVVSHDAICFSVSPILQNEMVRW